MPKITRATQKIFAQNGTDQLAAFGSMKTGTPIYTDNIEDLQTSDYEDGWENAIVADEAPFLEEMNGVQYGFSKQLAYLFQEGIAEYDAETTYYKNSIVKGLDSEGKLTLWTSLIDDNTGNNPAEDLTGTNWQVLQLGGSSGGTSLPTHSLIYSDRVLSFAESKGLAPLGSYVYKDAVSGSRYGYPDFYNTCVEELSSADNVNIAVAVNVHNTGCVIDSNFIVSGFSSRNFIQPTSGFYPSYYDGQPFEVGVKLNTTTMTEMQSFLGGCDSNDYYGIIMQFINNKLRIGSTNTGTSWNLINLVQGTKTYDINTDYWFKFEYTGTQYIASWSTDGKTYTPDITIDQSTAPAIRSFCLGNNLYGAANQEPLLGTIDIKECYIKINNELVWLGTQNLIKNTNGHIYYDIAQKPTADYLYNTYGACWAYGVDTENERIFLPRNDWFFKSGNANNVGKFNAAGLPNITGTAKAMGYAGRNDSGALYTTGASNESFAGGADGRAAEIINLDASRSNPIYGNSDTVQPPSVNQIVYMVVGNTETESAITDVTDVTTTENDTIPLFTGMYYDFTPNHVSWLKAGQQANSGPLYTTAYNTLVSELTDPTYGLKIIDVDNMQSDVDYSEYWKVDQDAMTFTTPTRTAERVLVAKKEPTAQDPTWYNWYSDGWLEQGGVDSSTNTTTSPISLIKPYTTADYSVLLTRYQDYSSTDADTILVKSKAQDSFVINKLLANINAIWQTSGYGAIPSLSDYTEDIKLYFKVANAVEDLELLNVGAITESLANKLDADHSNDTKPYITETYQNGTSWYRVWSDGWIEQGGYFVSNGTGYGQVTLMKPYSSSVYNIQVTEQQAAYTDSGTSFNWYGKPCGPLTNNSFYVKASVASQIGFHWLTIGY